MNVTGSGMSDRSDDNHLESERKRIGSKRYRKVGRESVWVKEQELFEM